MITAASGQLDWEWLGRVDYEPTIERLERQRERVLSGDAGAERLFLCEHNPVITLGRSADESHILTSGVPVVRTSRGGDVTYHGPGQLMVYPVIRLRAGVVSFLQAVARALASVLEHYGVAGAAWRRDPAGLWLGDSKIAACGIHLRRGVTIHGYALNVDTPPAAWQSIVPCGLADARVTSMAAELADSGAHAPAVSAVAPLAAPRIIEALAQRSSLGVGNERAPAI